jgi:cyclic pyranopterin phosphate synthase
MSARPELVDSFDRRIEYLRVSVTDRCNYRCSYCRPRAPARCELPDNVLGREELTRVIRLFAELGVRRVRLTGGEPLIRRDLTEIAAAVGALPGIEDLSLSTNGHLLERHASALKLAGVRRLNVSLDSLDPATFALITGGGDVHAVRRGIDAARAADLAPIKLNMVVMQGVNDGEIETMLAFAVSRGADLRYIETMPVGPPGRASMAQYYPASRILERLRRYAGAELFPVRSSAGAGPARYYQLGAGPVRVGVISAVSRHFCAGCNRVRLTAAGDLVLCLGHGDRMALRPALRAGASDKALKELIRAAVARKPERHDFLAAPAATGEVPMSALGG